MHLLVDRELLWRAFPQRDCNREKLNDAELQDLSMNIKEVNSQ